MIESAGPRLSGRDALSRPRRAARRSSGRWPTRRRARCAPSRARCWCSCRAPPKSAAPRRCCASASPIRRSTSSPLFGALDADVQDRAIAPAPPGRRKVVLATSIAETSLTIEGVRVVIDCGLARVPRYEPDVGLTRLETVRVSRAVRRSAPRPRRPHRARRLLSAVGRAADRLARSLPARRKSSPPISPASCSISRIGASPIRPRSPSSIRRRAPAWSEARALLRELGAIDGDGRITDGGQALRQLPLPPRLARMVVDARGARRRRRSPPRSRWC